MEKAPPPPTSNYYKKYNDIRPTLPTPLHGQSIKNISIEAATYRPIYRCYTKVLGYIFYSRKLYQN